MSITTTAPTNSGRGGAASGTVTGTSPLMAGAGQAGAPEEAPAVTSGIATQYYAELVPIPAASPRLWFFVANGWRVLNGASSLQFELVQQAFLGSGSTVTVWYDGATVAGLVVSGS